MPYVPKLERRPFVILLEHLLSMFAQPWRFLILQPQEEIKGAWLAACRVAKLKRGRDARKALGMLEGHNPKEERYLIFHSCGRGGAESEHADVTLHSLCEVTPRNSSDSCAGS